MTSWCRVVKLSGSISADDWKSIERQLTHSPHGRIVLYRDSLDDAISMLRVREAAVNGHEKKSSQRDDAARRR